METTGTITAVQRMSIHDGPGIRSTVFFKGCNLRCRWCHNPETWSPAPRHQFVSGRCISCGQCMAQCAVKCLNAVGGAIRPDIRKCTLCRRCETACPSGALSITGETLSAGEVVERVLRDRVFFRQSGGGVTLSGGEPTLQKDFALGILRALKKESTHTAMETNLCISFETIRELLPWVDLWMCDIKSYDPALHRKWTGKGNEIILDNFRRLSSERTDIIARTTIVPGVNDRPEEISAICDFLLSAGITRYELQPFHPLGFGKFEMLGLKNPMEDSPAVTAADLEPFREIARLKGLNTK